MIKLLATLFLTMFQLSQSENFYNPCGKSPNYFILSMQPYYVNNQLYRMCLNVNENTNKLVTDYCPSNPNYIPSMVWNFEDGILKNKKDWCVYGNSQALTVLPCSQVQEKADKWKYRCDLQFEDVNETNSRKCMHYSNAQKGPYQNVEKYYCTLDPVPDYQKWVLSPTCQYIE